MPSVNPFTRATASLLLMLAWMCASAQNFSSHPETTNTLKLSFSHYATGDGLAHEYITALLQDADGFLWVGTADGLNRFDGFRFRSHRHRADEPHSISGNHINGIFEDAQGRLWVSTRGHGLNLYDRRSARFKHFNAPAMLSDTVGQVVQDSVGALYVVTARGVNCIAPFAVPENVSSTSGHAITSIPLPQGFIAESDGCSQLKLYTGREGRVRIVGRKAIGRVEWSGGAGTEARLIIEHDFSRIAGFGGIEGVEYNEHTDELLLATGNSIVRCPATPGVNTLDVLTAVPDGVENFYLEQTANLLWYVSDHRVMRMDLRTRHAQSIDAYEPRGQQALLSSHIIYTDRSGNFWIGSSGSGLLKCSAPNYHFGENAAGRPPPPRVFLTGLRLFNKEADCPATDATSEDISYAHTLTLPHDQSMITLCFSALDFQHRDDLNYRYKLEGFDKDWVEAGSVHEAVYTNLDPGSYRFIAQARYANGAWGTTSSALRLRILPPWWLRWWAVMIFAAALAGCVYAIIRFRRAQLQKVERVRAAIARDLHDDLGSMVSTIAIYARVVEQQTQESGIRPTPALRKITENSGKVMETLNDIIWSISIRGEDTASLLHRMRSHAAEVFEEVSCTLHIDFENQPEISTLPVEKWKDLYLLFKEALNNVAKYAEADNVWVSLHQVQGHALLTIRDDGRGFDLERIRRGNGLKNMATRAAAIGGTLDVRTSPNAGTVVEVRV